MAMDLEGFVICKLASHICNAMLLIVVHYVCQSVYASKNAYNICCFLMDVTIMKAPMMTTNRIRTTIDAEIMMITVEHRRVN